MAIQSPCKRTLSLSNQRMLKARLHRLRLPSKGMVCLMKMKTWMMIQAATRQVGVLCCIVAVCQANFVIPTIDDIHAMMASFSLACDLYMPALA